MDQSLIISYSTDPHVEFDTSYWMRLEQVGQKSDTASQSEVAEVLDALYGTTPCVASKKETTETATGADSTGNETTATTVQFEGYTVPLYPVDTGTTPGSTDAETNEDGSLKAPVTEDEFNGIVAAVTDFNICKRKTDGNTLQLRVYRSHQTEPYKVIPGIGTITQTRYLTAEANEAPAISNAAGYDLFYPLASDLNCGFTSCQGSDGSQLTPPPTITVDASTLKWGILVTGLLDIQYTTEYDLLDIKVPLDKDGKMSNCSVFAYYHGQVYHIVLKAPVLDPTVEENDIEKLCGGTGAIQPPEEGKATCFKEVHHIVYCQCSYFESTASWDEEVSVPCPESFENDVGRFILGSESVNAGSTDCGETTAVHSPEYYKAVCCKWPGFDLPMCVATHAPYGGGRSIKRSPASIYEEYGANTKIVGIGPETGQICGEVITRQVTHALSCCDLAEQIVFNLTSSADVIGDFSSGNVTAFGGISPYSWTITGQGFYLNAGKTLKTLTTLVPQVTIYTGDACGSAQITVTDGCTSASIWVRSTDGQWVPRSFSPCAVTVPGALVWGQVTDEILGRYRVQQTCGNNTIDCTYPWFDFCSDAQKIEAVNWICSHINPAQPPCFSTPTATSCGNGVGWADMPPRSIAIFLFSGYQVWEWVC